MNVHTGFRTGSGPTMLLQECHESHKFCHMLFTRARVATNTARFATLCHIFPRKLTLGNRGTSAMTLSCPDPVWKLSGSALDERVRSRGVQVFGHRLAMIILILTTITITLITPITLITLMLLLIILTLMTTILITSLRALL